MRALLVLAAALTIVSATSAASAYCRSTTTRVPVGFHPRPGECQRGGIPLYWSNSCVGYYVEQRGTRQFPLDRFLPLVQRATTAWEATRCPGGGSPSIHMAYLGLTTADRAEVNLSGGPNKNTVLFIDKGWPHGSRTIALTTVSYGEETGAIYDADIEINTENTDFDLGGRGVGVHLDAVVLHELGHLLGLEHSGEPNAIMGFAYDSSSSAPTADDAAGVCSANTPNGMRATVRGPELAEYCDPHFAGPAEPPIIRNGCSVASGGSSVDAPVALLFIALALRRARTRDRKTRTSP